MRSRSGRPIDSHHEYTPYPVIGFHAPTIKDISTGRSKRAPKRPTSKITSRRVRARIGSADQTAIASAEVPCIGSADQMVVASAETPRIGSADQMAVTPAETPIPLPLPVVEIADPQVTAEVGAAAASLLVEAVQVILLISYILQIFH